MSDFFEVDGRFFDKKFAFPPIDEKHIQNAIMIAPFEGKMFVYGWNCFNDTGDPDTDYWGWEPLHPYDGMEGYDLIDNIQRDLDL